VHKEVYTYSKNTAMTDVYFTVPVFLVRLGGVPVKMQKVSKLKCIYDEVLFVCYYGTYLSIIMDFVVKKEDIQESMKNVRMIFGLAVVTWMHLYLRYPSYHVHTIASCFAQYRYCQTPHIASVSLLTLLLASTDVDICL
jgi:hypothetical protein